MLFGQQSFRWFKVVERNLRKDILQVDAFARRPLFGNPAAVVFDADDLSGATMQKIAQEMNLSETVFICRPRDANADYRARIFTPLSELPFAGHPTIAAAHAVLERFPEQEAPSVLRQECGIGVVPVEVLEADEGGRILRMTQAPPEFRDVGLSPSVVAAMLGCREDAVAASPIQVVSTGVPWLIVPLVQVATLSRLVPDQLLIARKCAGMGAAGVTAFAQHDAGMPVRLRARTFAPGEGVAEDPVCGSGNGAIAAYVARHLDTTEVVGAYRAEQGIEIGRDGTVHLSWKREGETLEIKVGGQAVTVLRGKLLL